MPGRTWVIAPDVATLERRWQRLINESDPAKKEQLFHPHFRRSMLGDRHLNKGVSEGLASHEKRIFSVASDMGAIIRPTRYGFRSFDRQWIVPDARIINQPNSNLWNSYSQKQLFITALDRSSPRSGPAISLTDCLPDHDHYRGSFAGRVYPLWTDAGATTPNIRPELLALLAHTYGAAVTPEDALAYVAAIMAHPAFTARFSADLKQPGLRLPLTAMADLFAEGVALGREIVWLHCYGERFVDASAGRPKGPPRLAKDAPRIPVNGAIPPAPAPLPDTMTYDAATRRLSIGGGIIENVTPAMWAYEVSGKNVLRQWFSYRRRDRTKPQIGDKRPPSPLEKIVPDGWLHEYTTDLLDLLNVLGRLAALEPRQADVLKRICEDKLIAPATLHRSLLANGTADN